jgi:hypothetical protein
MIPLSRRSLVLLVFLVPSTVNAQETQDAATVTDAIATTADGSSTAPDAGTNLPAPAPPDPARDAARTHFQRGVAWIEQERWADAIVELERARDLRVTPAVLYNLGLSYRAVGRNLEAIEAFRAFTRTANDPALLERVHAYIRELTAALGSIELRVAPPSARAYMDGNPITQTGPIEVDPGRHVITVEADGYATESRTLEVARGTQTTVVFRMVPTEVSSRVVVRTDPPGALVRIDGQAVGFGHVEEVLRPGSHTLEVSAPGHTTFRRTFEAVMGQTQTIRAVLAPNRSVLSSPWLWIGITAVVAGTALAAWFLLSDIEPPYRGTLGNVTDALTVGRW